MSFLGIIAFTFTIYLVIEERERRALNPDAAKWSARLFASAKRYMWFLGSVVLAFGWQLMRGKQLSESLAQAGIGLGLYIFVTLHAAVLALPRKAQNA